MIAIAVAKLLQASPQVTALVGTNIRPKRLSTGITLPAIRYSVRTDKPNVAHSGYTGFNFTNFDIGVHAATYEELSKVVTALRTLFLNYKGSPIANIDIHRIIINNALDIDLAPDELRTEQYAYAFDIAVQYRSI